MAGLVQEVGRGPADQVALLRRGEVEVAEPVEIVTVQSCELNSPPLPIDATTILTGGTRTYPSWRFTM
ncbi:MAG: hypothetical protein ABJA34_02670 [Pseudonocardiales bacterium]